jgi:formamidopyrimidine-DNA glycosylase
VPELPEVEVVRAGLAPAVTGARIAAVDVLDSRALTRHDATSGDFESLVTGAHIEAAVRRGKFLWMPIGPDRAVVGHLGMSGQLLLRTPDHPGDDRHTRIRLHLDHPEHGELRVDFLDQRTFGSLAVDRLVPTTDGEVAGYSAAVTGPWERSIPAQVAHISRDPLDPAFDDDAFVGTLAHRPSAVKRVLLDQNLVSGVGNIYADESLWAVQMHGEQPASSLSRRRVRDLLAAVRDVLGRALAEGGTSFDEQYVNVNGASGYFGHSLNAYGRAGLPCPRCGTPMVREAFMNRSSYRCPSCQRLRMPRQARGR